MFHTNNTFFFQTRDRTSSYGILENMANWLYELRDRERDREREIIGRVVVCSKLVPEVDGQMGLDLRRLLRYGWLLKVGRIWMCGGIIHYKWLGSRQIVCGRLLFVKDRLINKMNPQAVHNHASVTLIADTSKSVWHDGVAHH